MFKKFETLGIGKDLLKKTSIPIERYEFLYEKLQVIVAIGDHSIESFLIISEAWQLELLMGDIEFFKKHAHKRDSQGYNIAHYAALSGNPEVMEWIKEWDENYLIEKEQSKLRGLASCGVISQKISMLDWLWGYNKDLFKEVDTHNNYTIAIRIARIGWFEGIKWINETLPELLVERNKQWGGALLDVIIKYCPLEVLDYLKLNNRNVLLQRNNDGFSIMHRAARMGLTNVLRRLLENKSELMVDIQININHQTLLQSAAFSGNKETFDFCFNLDSKQSLICDNKGNGFIIYALLSLNSQQLNHALSFSDSPDRIGKIRGMPSGLQFNNHEILNTIHTALDENISLQSVTYLNPFLNAPPTYYLEKAIYINIQKKIYRNLKIHKDFNEFIQRAILFCFKFDQKSNDGAGLLQDVCYMICNVMFSLYIPDRKNYNFDTTFFALARKPVAKKQDEVPDLISNNIIYN
jgi:hypothetical protein